MITIAAKGRAGVVVHVGAHKTGTTLIQRYLDAHPNTLYRNGIDYVPRAEMAPMVGWGDRLVADRSPVSDVLTRAGRGRTLLLSYENFCGAPFAPARPGLYPKAPVRIDALAAALRDAGLADAEVTILLTVRPQHELVESYYLQLVNMGSWLPFDDWLAGVNLESLSWWPLVERLRAVFGSHATRIVDFGVVRDVGGVGYVEHALGRCGIRIPVDRSWRGPSNPSVSARGLSMLLRGNALLTDAEQRNGFRIFVQRNFDNTTGGRPQLFEPATRDALRARFADEYAALVAPGPGVSS